MLVAAMVVVKVSLKVTKAVDRALLLALPYTLTRGCELLHVHVTW